LLLADLIEALSSSNADDVVEERVLGPLGLTEHIVMSAARAQSILSEATRKIEAPIAYDTGHALPLLSSFLPSQAQDIGIVAGGLASMHGMALLGSAILRAWTGTRLDGLPSTAMLRRMLASRRGRVMDEALKKTCDFAGGFMIGADDHGLGAGLPGEIFGHASMMPSAGMAIDPKENVVVAVLVAGISDDPWHDIAVRHSLMGDLWRETLDKDARPGQVMTRVDGGTHS
jgi:CubicO group peptidase (beta-lactamase class C family)